MALSDVNIGDFMPHNTMMPDLKGFDAVPGSVDTGFHRFTDVSSDSGMTDVNTTAMSPYNPFFAQRATDRPAYDSATDPYRAQMKQAARVGNGVAYTSAADAIRRIDDVYGTVHGEMGVNDRETMDAFRYGQSCIAGRNLIGVEDEIAKMQSAYIAEQAIRRGRHVRDLKGEEAQLDAQFDFGFDQAFDRAGSTGRLSPETQTAMTSYRSNPAEKEMRKLSAKRALQEIEKTDGVLYTASVRGNALQKFCEYYAMSKAFGAFGTLDDTRIMREAVKTTLDSVGGQSTDRSIFGRFNEQCAKYADGFFSYSDSPTSDLALGMQVKDRNGNPVQTGFVPVLRQVFEQQAAEDLMSGKEIGSNTVALSEKIAARLKDKYGFVQGKDTDAATADAVWKRIADDIAEQSRNGHVDCSKLATLYVQDGQRPVPTEFKTVDGGLYNTLEKMSGDLLDSYIGGRPAYYGGFWNNVGSVIASSAAYQNGYDPGGMYFKSRAAEKDRFAGAGMRKGVDSTVDDALMKFGPSFVEKNKEFVSSYKKAIADLIEYVNTVAAPNYANAGEYKDAAHAVTTALALSANLATISNGKFKPSPYSFGSASGKKWSPGTAASFENAFSSLRTDLEAFLKANDFNSADHDTKTALTVAKSYLTAISRFGEAAGDPDEVGAKRREGARVAVARLFGGIDPFTTGALIGGQVGEDRNSASSFSPYAIPEVADSENARAAAFAGMSGLVTDQGDMKKQQMLNRFIQAAYSDKMNPVDATRIGAITEQLLGENCQGMSKNPAMMDAARRELTPAVAIAMHDAGHFVLQGAANGDIEVDDPDNPGKKMKAVKAFVPTANIWDDSRAVEVLRRRLGTTLKRLGSRSAAYAKAELDAFTSKQEATANVQLRRQQAAENGMPSIPSGLR